jgi:hypothetical protein
VEAISYDTFLKFDIKAEFALSILPIMNFSSFSRALRHESTAKMPASAVCKLLFLSALTSSYCS